MGVGLMYQATENIKEPIMKINKVSYTVQKM